MRKIACLVVSLYCLSFSGGVINHLNTVIMPPDSLIDSIQLHDTIYLCSRSHGTQIKAGMDSLARLDAKYATPEWHAVWGQPNAFWQGSGSEDTRTYLDAHPGVTVCMFVWCRELAADMWTSDSVIKYLDTMNLFEAEYPDIKFIYSTGNSQWYGGGNSEMINRWDRHEQIRDSCIVNDKWLFDFGNMDAYYWSGSAWTDSSYDYGNGTYDTVEMLHHEYDNVASEADPAHTTWTNGLNKGRAMWHLLAILRGWEGPQEQDQQERRANWSMVRPVVRTFGRTTSVYLYEPVFSSRADSSAKLYRGSITSSGIRMFTYNILGDTDRVTIPGDNLSQAGESGIWQFKFPADSLPETDSICKFYPIGSEIDTAAWIHELRLR